jgi:hypothetical protein
MALKGSQADLATALKVQMKTAKTYEEAWEKFAEIIVDHLIENTLVVGFAPSGGGPIGEGKIQ